MTKSVTFSITAGLPFSKTFIITLPTGRSWWLQRQNFEVRAQIREKPDTSSTLILDLIDYINVTYASNVITVYLQMSGEDTRKLTRSGFYDLIVSDVGTTDQRAYKIVEGPARVSPLVTSA